MGKVGKDDFGDGLVLMMNMERVQTRSVKFNSTAKTAMTYRKIKFDYERMWAETVKEKCFLNKHLGSKGVVLGIAPRKSISIKHLGSARKRTLEVGSASWNEADIIEVSRQELEFLLDEDNYVRKRNYRPQYYAEETGSGDAVVAAIMRKLTTHPEMYEDQDVLERELRFAVAAGIISQRTIGAVRGFPTESATQNLKEQVYVPSMW
ncbi:hypothetical protein ACFX19_033387 [Malus domestica]